MSYVQGKMPAKHDELYVNVMEGKESIGLDSLGGRKLHTYDSFPLSGEPRATLVHHIPDCTVVTTVKRVNEQEFSWARVRSEITGKNHNDVAKLVEEKYKEYKIEEIESGHLKQ